MVQEQLKWKLNGRVERNRIYTQVQSLVHTDCSGGCNAIQEEKGLSHQGGHKPAICWDTAVWHNTHRGTECAVFSPGASTKGSDPVQVKGSLPPRAAFLKRFASLRPHCSCDGQTRKWVPSLKHRFTILLHLGI